MTPETRLKKDVKQVLGLYGWYSWHNLQGLGSYPGIPDIIAVKNGEILFCELKAPKGKQSPKQKEFQENIEAQGFTYLLIKNIDDVLRRIKE